MVELNAGITAPKGYRAAGEAIGIKNGKREKKDLALIASDVPAVMAGCFTTNKVKAAPVVWDMDIASKNRTVRGIAVNSGNANACTGERGAEDNKKIAEAFAGELNCGVDDILVCSTGVIGVYLPIDIIVNGVAETSARLTQGEQGAVAAAQAIMTTDTFPKTATVECIIGGKKVTVAGMAKGSGMIHPNMATMLAFITTDAHISREMLDKALRESVADTYNMISVDGDMSTNDTILALANGLAGNGEITCEDENYTAFYEALNYVNERLAISIARDGEGATKLITVKVGEAATKHDAAVIARSVVSSSLFKAMIFGADANVGRIMCAMGYSGGDFDPSKVTIHFFGGGESVLMMEDGNTALFDEELAARILGYKEITVDIRLSGGDCAAVAWGCDLTYDYVKINGDYRS